MVQLVAGEARQRAQQALSNSPVYALRDVRVEDRGDRLILSGCVDSFYHKQMAQEVVRSVARNMELVNSIDVDD